MLKTFANMIIHISNIVTSFSEIELVYENLGDFAVVPLDILKYLIEFFDRKSLINVSNTNREFRNLYSNKRIKYFDDFSTIDHLFSQDIRYAYKCEYNFKNNKYIQKCYHKVTVEKSIIDDNEYNLLFTFADVKYTVLMQHYEHSTDIIWHNEKRPHPSVKKSLHMTNKLTEFAKKLCTITDYKISQVYNHIYLFEINGLIDYLERLFR